MAKSSDRWAGRPVSSATVSALVFLIPLAAAVLVGWLAHRLVVAPAPLGPRLVWWVGQIALSALVFACVERVTRRFLPLAALLKMTMVFPDRAPSRLAVARSAGRTKDLEARIDHAMNEAPTGSIGDAAKQILALATALSSHDRRTRGHSERVRVLTDMIADELELSEDTRDRLRWSSLLHDVGKLTVHPHILNKPGKPNAEEWVALQQHPLEGAKLTAPLVPWLGEWALAVEQHHEKFDGRGYPYGLAGEQISYAARIVAVADVFETMTAKRSYKDALSPAVARAELTRCAGTHFDADIVRAFLNISLGRLRWAVGPASLIAQLPFVGQLPLVGGQATGALAGMTGATALGAAALSVGSIVMPHLLAPTTATQTPAKPAEVQLAMTSGTSPNRLTAPAASAQHVAAPTATSRQPAASVGSATSPATSVAPPVIAPPIAAPPVVSPPPATSPPVTGPRITVPPVTLPPITVPPITQPRITVPPVTLPPITLPPIALPPVTLPPVTLPPITLPPVTVPPTAVPPPTTRPPRKSPPSGGLLAPVVGLLHGLLGVLGRGR